MPWWAALVLHDGVVGELRVVGARDRGRRHGRSTARSGCRCRSWQTTLVSPPGEGPGSSCDRVVEHRRVRHGDPPERQDAAPLPRGGAAGARPGGPALGVPLLLDRPDPHRAGRPPVPRPRHARPATSPACSPRTSTSAPTLITDHLTRLERRLAATPRPSARSGACSPRAAAPRVEQPPRAGPPGDGRGGRGRARRGAGLVRRRDGRDRRRRRRGRRPHRPARRSLRQRPVHRRRGPRDGLRPDRPRRPLRAGAPGRPPRPRARAHRAPPARTTTSTSPTARSAPTSPSTPCSSTARCTRPTWSGPATPPTPTAWRTEIGWPVFTTAG